MKITYFKYWIEHGSRRYRQSIQKLVEEFSKLKDIKIRMSFESSGDNLFVYPIMGNTYLFVITKDNELIKAISADSISQTDISEKLSKNEHIGFCSYVYLAKDFLAIASTIHGPKIKRWNELINSIFRRCGKDDMLFYTSPFESSVDLKTALSFSFKSSVKFELRKGSPAFDTIMAAWNGADDTETIAVEMKPSMKGQMPHSFDAVIENAASDGLKKLIVRGKEELEDQLTDHYLIGTGRVGRYIAAKDEREICLEMQEDVNDNISLKEALHDYRNDTDFKNNLPLYSGIDNHTYLLSHLVDPRG